MIAAPRTNIPIPDAVRDLSTCKAPDLVRAEKKKATRAGRMLTEKVLTAVPLQLRLETSAHHHAAICAANKHLARHGLALGWGDLPNLRRKEER